MAKTDRDLLPTRWSLVNRLKNLDDQESWKDFFDLYWRLLYSVAIKAGLTEQEAQEVVQETVISVAKKMPEFKANSSAGSFKGWLMQLTRWRIVDQLRKRLPARLMNGCRTDFGRTPRTATVERVPDPAGPALEALWDQEWQIRRLETAMERVKLKVNPKQFQIFHLLAVKNLPPTQVAELLRVKVDNVYLIKHRISALVKQEIQELEAKSI